MTSATKQNETRALMQEELNEEHSAIYGASSLWHDRLTHCDVSDDVTRNGVEGVKDRQMARSEADKIQEIQSRIGALRVALDACLSALAAQYGTDASTKIASLRDQLIRRFKESDMVPQREVDHAKIVKPAIEVIQGIFDDALRRLS
jgi:hypothetical protein